MTRKDYVAVAKILNEFQPLIGDQFVFEDLVKEFADFFHADNKNFSPNKFEMACFDLILN